MFCACPYGFVSFVWMMGAIIGHKGILAMIGFDGTDTRQKSRTELCDRLWARELFQAVATRTMTRPKTTISKEANVFRLLRVADKQPAEMIDMVLSWHCKNLCAKYHPVAYTASEFRKKFVKIKTMFLLSDDAPRPEIKLNQHLSGVHVRLRSLGWKGVQDRLAEEIFYSWKFTSDFQSYLYERSIDEKDPQNSLCKFVYERFPRNWVEVHYSTVHEYYHKTAARFEKHRLTKDHHAFRHSIMGIVEEYVGRTKGCKVFLSLLEDYNEGWKTRRYR